MTQRTHFLSQECCGYIPGVSYPNLNIEKMSEHFSSDSSRMLQSWIETQYVLHELNKGAYTRERSLIDMSEQDSFREVGKSQSVSV